MDIIQKALKNRISYGIVLAILGIDIMGLIKVVIGRDARELSLMVAIMTLALMIPVFNTSFLANKDILITILYGFYIIIVSVFSEVSILEPVYGTAYIIYNFGIILCVYLTYRKVHFDSLNKILLVISMMANLLAFVLVMDWFRQSGSLTFNVLGDGIIRRTTPSFIAFITILAIMVNWKNRLLNNRRMDFITKTVSLLLATIILVAANRRSIDIALAIIFLFHYRNVKKKRLNMHVFKNIVIIVFASVCMAVILYLKVEIVRTTLNNTIVFMTSGIKTYFGQDSTDVAASFRSHWIDTVPREYLLGSSLKQFVFGRGYMQEWMDVPVLQAFWDMGFIGGVLFVYSQIFVPLKYIRRKTNNYSLMFFQYIAIYSVLMRIVSGLPYTGCFYPVLLIMFSNVSKRKKINECDNFIC